MIAALYNDNDAKAAAWLRELIAEGLLPAGEVSTVSIKEIAADDCADTSHFFAGIGGWPLALEIAGWPADRAVWTGSCPCQPFSAAGKRAGANDPRHLWPDFLRLIRERRPPVIFGEQVASSDGRAWLAGVRADLEALGYAVGAADLCSAGVGAPHIRQRLYWGAKRLAVPYGWQCDGLPGGEGRVGDGQTTGRQQGNGEPECCGEVVGMADADLQASGGRGVCAPGEGHSASNGAARERSAGLRETERMADASGAGLERRRGMPKRADQCTAGPDGMASSNRTLRDPRERWRLAYCRDDQWRRVPVEPEIFPLADGLPGRVGLLRGAGNAIDPHLASRFVRAFMEAAG